MNLLDISIVVGIGGIVILCVLLKLTKVPKEIYRSKTIYYDHKEKPIEALFSPKYGIVGKPDYILHTKDGLVPLEIKHSQRPKQPYFSHVMQLTSYCLLIEEVMGTIPKYGFIQYKDGSPFTVPYTSGRKNYLLKIAEEMRNFIDRREYPSSQKKYVCKNCRDKINAVAS